jgi:hypothetical protein
MDGWIVSLSNEIEDDSLRPAFESMYVKVFGYETQTNDKILWLALAKVTVMTVMANLTSNSIVSGFFDGKYGRTARPVNPTVNPTERIQQSAATPSQPLSA